MRGAGWAGCEGCSFGGCLFSRHAEKNLDNRFESGDAKDVECGDKEKAHYCYTDFELVIEKIFN